MKSTLLNLRQMEPLVREATKKALSDYRSDPRLHDKKLSLISMIDDEYGVFKLILTAERSQDAKILTCTKVNLATGEVDVDIFLDGN